MQIHILSTDTPVDDLENLFTSMGYALEAVIGLRERIIEAEDTKLADDAGSILSLYIEYTSQLIARGNELALGVERSALQKETQHKRKADKAKGEKIHR